MTDIPPTGEPEDPDSSVPFGFPQIPGFDFSQLDLSQVMRWISSPGPINWEIAHQVATAVSLDGAQEEPLIADTAIAELTELARAAESHVAAETGFDAPLGFDVHVIGRRAWADLHLDALHPVLEALALAMQVALDSGSADNVDGTNAFDEVGSGAFGMPQGFDPLAGIMTMLAPLLLGVQAGSMVGHLGQHAFGRFDLPLPTNDSPSLVFVETNLAAFETAWSLDGRDLRFYVALHESLHASVRSIAWVSEHLVSLATKYVSAFEVNPAAFEEQFGSIDPSDPSSLAEIAANPETLLGAMRSEQQAAVLRTLHNFTLVLEGYVDVLLERIGTRMLVDFARIHEAMQRHRVENGEAGRFVEGLLGLRLKREDYERGQEFARGVIERAGVEGLNRLWHAERMLPTPNEIEAPGLWLARIDLPELGEDKDGTDD